DPKGLLSYQVAPANALLASLAKHRSALDASDMGVGKTYTAGAVIRALNRPTLVVGPKVSRVGWERMGQHMGVEFDYINYEMVRTGRAPYGKWVEDNRGRDVVEHFHWHPGIKHLVFDEAHRCTSLEDTLQTKLLIAARRMRIPTVALSATIAETPLNFRALGYLLGLHHLEDDWRYWAMEHGVRYDIVNGLHFTKDRAEQQEVLKKLHATLFPDRGCRVRITDLPDFPKCKIMVQLVQIMHPSRMNKLFEEMKPAIEAVRAGRRFTLDERAKLLFAWQESELLMIPIYVELAKDAVASGKHVALFVNFRASVRELCRLLNTQCFVDGSQVGQSGAMKRQANIDAFQADKEPFIICTSAGSESIGLHDVRGEFSRLGIVSLGWSAQKARQAFGRLPRNGSLSTSLYICPLAAGTVQESIHRCVTAKLDRMDLLNDGDLIPGGNLPVSELTEPIECDTEGGEWN